MMTDWEIWRAAERMRIWANAAVQVAMHADKLLDRGDPDGFRVWTSITAAINELDRVGPRGGALN